MAVILSHVLFGLTTSLPLLLLVLLVCALFIRHRFARRTDACACVSGRAGQCACQDSPPDAPDDLRLCQPSTGREDDWTVLYETSFPEEESVGVEKIRSHIDSGKRLLQRTVGPGGELLCFSLLYKFHDFMWLSYLATDPGQRSLGVGSKHLLRLIELVKQQYPEAAGLFFDIEAPFESGLDPDTALQRHRRLKFYERLGAKRLSVGKKYFMPNFIPGGPPVAAELLGFAFSETPENGGVDLRLLIRRVYQEIYGLSPDDAFITQVTDQF